MTDLDAIITKLSNTREDIKDLQARAELLEFQIVQAMEADGATVHHTGTYKAEIPYTNQYDQGRLLPLLEVLPQELLGKVYRAKHSIPKIIPAAFNMKLKGQIEALGGEARAILEAATFKKRGTLKITEVQQEEADAQA